MNSVNDIVNEVYEPGVRRSTAINLDSPSRGSLFRPQQSQVPSTPKPSAPAPSSKPLYVIVFGYPADKVSITIDYFRSLGDATEADPNIEILNCFRIGYTNPAEAMRAVRKNGEVLGGSFMVGVKWADPVQAEALLGSPLARSPFSFSTSAAAPDISSPDITMSDASPPTRGFQTQSPNPESSALALRTHTPPVGTPIRLAPSASAFRKPGLGGKMPPVARPEEATMGGGAMAMPASPSKGVLGQVSDLIFGW